MPLCTRARAGMEERHGEFVRPSPGGSAVSVYTNHEDLSPSNGPHEVRSISQQWA